MTHRTGTTDEPLPPLTRRALLGTGALAATGLALGPLPSFATSGGTVLPLVDPLPAGTPDRSTFAADEQIMGTYLVLVAPLANSIVDDDPERYGWMEDGWWRTPVQPFNARIMEHVATLAWFYATERPWNPYRGDAELLARLDAALGFYLGLQHDDGAWPEYSWTEHGLAPTSFGTVALSATLRDLRTAGVLAGRQTEIEAALRKAATWLVDLTRPHWRTPTPVTNQVIAGLAGVSDVAIVLDDPAIAAPIDDRLEFLWQHSHAPAGHTLEPLGYDFGYSFTVALPDFADVALKTDSPVPLRFAEALADFYQYAVVWEPDGSGGLHYSGLCVRNGATDQRPTIADTADRSSLGRVFLDRVPALAAFHPTDAEKDAERDSWAGSAEPVPVPAKGNTSPRTWMHVPRSPQGPTAAQRAAAIAGWRTVAEDAFTELRFGEPSLKQHYLFVRRPGYYLGALHGTRVSGYTRQRFGNGLLWHPAAGMFLWSVNDWAKASWTSRLTAAPDQPASQSAYGSLPATYHDGTDPAAPAIPAEQLTGHAGVFTAAAGATSASGDPGFRSATTFWSDGIVQQLTTGGEAEQAVPLVLRPDDRVSFADGTPYVFGSSVGRTTGGLRVVRGEVTLWLTWDADRAVTLAPTTQQLLGGTRTQHVLKIIHPGSLRLEATLAGQPVDPVRPYTVAAELTGRRLAVHVLNQAGKAADVLISADGIEPDWQRGVGDGRGVYRLFDLPAGAEPPRLVTVTHRVGRRTSTRQTRLR